MFNLFRNYLIYFLLNILLNLFENFLIIASWIEGENYENFNENSVSFSD